MNRQGRRAALGLALCGAVWLADPTEAAMFRVQAWQDYGPRERYEALRNYRRHEQLPEARQREVERQYQRWQEMPEDERAKIRENYERYRSMSPREQERIERRYRDLKREGQP